MKELKLTISGTPFNTRDFTWNTSLTVSHNKNKLVKFTNDELLTERTRWDGLQVLPATLNV